MGRRSSAATPRWWLELREQDGGGKRAEWADVQPRAIFDGLFDRWVDLFEDQCVDTQRRGHERGGTAERPAVDGDGLVGMARLDVGDGGADVVAFEIAHGDRVAAAFAVAAEVDQERGVARVAEEAGSIEHAQARTANGVSEDDGAAAGWRRGGTRRRSSLRNRWRA